MPIPTEAVFFFEFLGISFWSRQLPNSWSQGRQPWCTVEMDIFAWTCGKLHTFTLPETNIAPKNGWLEYYFPIGFRPIFRGEPVSFREIYTSSTGPFSHWFPLIEPLPTGFVTNRTFEITSTQEKPQIDPPHEIPTSGRGNKGFHHANTMPPIYISSQIIIFHQPRFPWNKGVFPY